MSYVDLIIAFTMQFDQSLFFKLRPMMITLIFLVSTNNKTRR